MKKLSVIVFFTLLAGCATPSNKEQTSPLDEPVTREYARKICADNQKYIAAREKYEKYHKDLSDVEQIIIRDDLDLNAEQEQNLRKSYQVLRYRKDTYESYGQQCENFVTAMTVEQIGDGNLIQNRQWRKPLSYTILKRRREFIEQLGAKYGIDIKIKMNNDEVKNTGILSEKVLLSGTFYNDSSINAPTKKMLLEMIGKYKISQNESDFYGKPALIVEIPYKKSNTLSKLLAQKYVSHVRNHIQSFLDIGREIDYQIVDNLVTRDSSLFPDMIIIHEQAKE